MENLQQTVESNNNTLQTLEQKFIEFTISDPKVLETNVTNTRGFSDLSHFFSTPATNKASFRKNTPEDLLAGLEESLRNKTISLDLAYDIIAESFKKQISENKIELSDEYILKIARYADEDLNKELETYLKQKQDAEINPEITIVFDFNEEQKANYLNGNKKLKQQYEDYLKLDSKISKTIAKFRKLLSTVKNEKVEQDFLNLQKLYYDIIQYKNTSKIEKVKKENVSINAYQKIKQEVTNVITSKKLKKEFPFLFRKYNDFYFEETDTALLLNICASDELKVAIFSVLNSLKENKKFAKKIYKFEKIITKIENESNYSLFEEEKKTSRAKSILFEKMSKYRTLRLEKKNELVLPTLLEALNNPSLIDEKSLEQDFIERRLNWEANKEIVDNQKINVNLTAIKELL